MNCAGISFYRNVCGEPARFAVYVTPEDAEGVCARHLAQVVRRRVAASEIKFVKVCEVGK